MFLLETSFLLRASSIREGRTWAIAVRRGSCKSLFLLNSGPFFPGKQGNSVLNFGSLTTLLIAIAQVLSPLIQREETFRMKC